jgi:hypothetical protein
MTKVDAYGARREAEVMQDTWGHLAPQQDRTYKGVVTFTVGCFGDLAVISAEFEGLPDSPWLYEDLHQWIWDQKPEEGKVYRFEGSYCRDPHAQFDGELAPVDLSAVTNAPNSVVDRG